MYFMYVWSLLKPIPKVFIYSLRFHFTIDSQQWSWLIITIFYSFQVNFGISASAYEDCLASMGRIMKWMVILYTPLYHPTNSFLSPTLFLIFLIMYSLLLSVTANVLQTTIAFAVHIALAVVQANVNGFKQSAFGLMPLETILIHKRVNGIYCIMNAEVAVV